MGFLGEKSDSEQQGESEFEHQHMLIDDKGLVLEVHEEIDVPLSLENLNNLNRPLIYVKVLYLFKKL